MTFNEIPNNRVPFTYSEIDGSGAVRNASANTLIGLIIGQKLAAGTKTANQPFLVTSEAQGAEYFGRGSMIHEMLKIWFKGNKTTELWVIALEDANAGVKAAGSITYGGAVTKAGTLVHYIGGQKVSVAAEVGDNGAAIATKMQAAIAAALDLLVTSLVDGVTASKLNVTFRHKGAVGNGYDMNAGIYDDEVLPEGLTAVFAPLAGGDGDPDIATAIAAMGDKVYDVIANPYMTAANLTALEAELTRRFDAKSALNGHAFCGKSDTVSGLVTFGDGRNSKHVTVIGAEGSPCSAFAWASALAASAAFYLELDPARQLRTLPLVGIIAPKEVKQFTREEQAILLNHGTSTFTVDAEGIVRLSRVITMYKTNALGAPDESFLDVMTKFTVAYIRKDWNAHVDRKYPRHKLAKDGTRFAVGQAIVTPLIIKAEAVSKFTQWETNGLVEGFSQFKNDLYVEIDATNGNRVNLLMSPDLINNLMIMGTKIGFLL